MVSVLGFIIVFTGSSLHGKEITPMQLLYTTRQVFPDCRELTIFVTADYYQKSKSKIARAVAQNHFKPHVFIIGRSSDIGNALGRIGKRTVLVVFDAKLLNKSNNRLYILSKCKNKRIAIVTSSKRYADSGATVGVYVEDGDQIKTVLNLKHSAYLKEKFTQELISRVGFEEIID